MENLKSEELLGLKVLIQKVQGLNHFVESLCPPPIAAQPRTAMLMEATNRAIDVARHLQQMILDERIESGHE
jgi:hypothetical protein